VIEIIVLILSFFQPRDTNAESKFQTTKNSNYFKTFTFFTQGVVAQLWPCLEYDICIIFVYFIFYEGGEEQFSLCIVLS